MLARNLLYTGVTRGKRFVVLVGQRKALAIAVRNEGTKGRRSKLRDWLVATDRINHRSLSEREQHDATQLLISGSG
jgi:exodeoxyribonuclease V alpha subunit